MLNPRSSLILPLVVLMGCAKQWDNPTPPTAEDQVLADYVQLTHNLAAAGEAYFSPDMQWVVFQAATRPGEDHQMHLARLEWEGDRITGIHTPVRISPEGSWNSCGFFSPDGHTLIFGSTDGKQREAEPPTTRPEMIRPIAPRGPTTGAPTTRTSPTPGGRPPRSYRWNMPKEADIVRVDNWKSAIAAIPPGGRTDLTRNAITSNDAHDAECAFSPDGKWIVYMSKATGDSELYVMRPDGSRQTRLTHVEGYDGGPFFSPDGKRVVYRTDRKKPDELQIHVADLAFDKGGNITGVKKDRALTDNGKVNFGPWWHPDNKHVIWANSLHGQRNYELYLMRADGSRKTRITFDESPDLLPVFSPDGKWLMWTNRRAKDQTSQIWVARFKMPKGA